LASEVAVAMQTPGASRDRLVADVYQPDAETDPLGCGERAFNLLPQVHDIETRLKPSIKDGVLPPIPQSLIEMRRWNARAMEQGLISADERVVLDDFAHYGNITVQVDDFGADLDMGEALQKTQEPVLIKSA